MSHPVTAWHSAGLRPDGQRSATLRPVQHRRAAWISEGHSWTLVHWIDLAGDYRVCAIPK